MEDGTVGHNPHTCIGCGICTWSCPYHAPKLSRKLGIAMKCDSCADRRSQGRKPACVEACLTHCLDFRDLEELTEAQKKQEVMVQELFKNSVKSAVQLKRMKERPELKEIDRYTLCSMVKRINVYEEQRLEIEFYYINPYYVM